MAIRRVSPENML